MATTLGELFVNIKADTDDFNDDIDKVKTKTQDAGDTATATGTKVKNMFTGVAVAAIVVAIKEVGQASLDAASDAEETQNKFDAVFSSIDDVANIMATDLADAYGLSETASRTMLSATGDLLTGMDFTQESALDLSSQVLSLGTDLASFTNYSGGAEGAVDALTSGLLGERESMKSLGISISEAQVKAEVLRMTQEGLTFDTEAQADAQATLNLAMAQSKNAIGDFERSQDSLANQTRIAESAVENLKTQMGRALIPTATTATSIFGSLTGKLAEYIEKMNDVREAEDAMAEGIATKEQEVLLLDNKIISIEKQIQSVELLQETYKYADKATQDMYDNQISNLERQLTSLSLTKDGVEAQKKADEDLAIAEAERAEAEAKAEAEREAAAEAAKQRYEVAVSLIEGVIEAEDTEVETIDKQIEAIQNMEAQDEETKEKQKEALEILTEARELAVEDAETLAAEKAQAEIVAEQEAVEAILELAEEKAELREGDFETYLEQLTFQETEAIRLAEEQGLAVNEIEEYYRDLRKEAEDAEKLAKQEAMEKTLSDTEEYASSILGIFDNVYTTQLNNIETETASKIAALDEEEMGEEEYADAVSQIEYDAAMQSWEIEKEQLAAEKANSLISIAINTAIGVSKAWAQGGIFGLAGALLVASSGAAQASAVYSTPDPTEPDIDTYFAEGGVATGATTAVVGEDEGEVMLGMGAKGAPLIDELATRIGDKMGSSGNAVIVNLNGNGIFSQSDLDNFAEKIYNSTIKVQKRRGII